MKIYKLSQSNHIYHCTFYKNLESIVHNGLKTNMPSSIGGPSYDSHRQNKLFGTSSVQGAKRWLEKLIGMTEHEYSDNFVEIMAIPVVIRFSQDNHKPDNVAIQENIDESALYFEEDIETDMEIWNGHAWIDLADYKSLDLSDAYYKMFPDDDFYYIKENSPLFNPLP